MKAVIAVLALALLMSTQLAYEGAPSAASAGSRASSDDDDDPIGGDDPVPSDDFFFVHADPRKGVKTYTHIEGEAWTEKCKIDLNASSAADRDKYCVVEINEMDLYLNELKLVYNLPEFKECKYVVRQAFFSFRYQPGRGPTTISYTEGASGAIDTDTLSATAPGPDNAGVTVNSTGGLKCSFNHQPDGPDCCYGDYTANVLRYNPDTSAYDPVVLQGNWGGKPASCAKGPAVDTHPLTEAGYPSTIWEYLTKEASAASLKLMRTGLEAMTFQKISLGLAVDRSDRVRINFAKLGIQPAAAGKESEPSEDADTDDDPYTGTLTIPAASKELYGTNLYASNFYEDHLNPPMATDEAAFGIHAWPFYRYLCANEAGEIHAQIRLMIREWNTVSEFEKVANTADANVSGTEPNFPFHDYNDKDDWKDILDDPMSFPNSFPKWNY